MYTDDEPQDKSSAPPYPSAPYAVQVDDPPSEFPQEEFIKTGEWDDGLCDCCSSCTNCCTVLWCPCVSVAQISHRLQIVPYGFALLVSLASILAGVGVLHCIFVWQLRSKTRERFDIPGSSCGDCCVATWCNCCALAQVATHVKSYKPGGCDLGPIDTLPGYP